jgi:glutamate/tyrosine decarboxylase-like PLP-dependent enzyme
MDVNSSKTPSVLLALLHRLQELSPSSATLPTLPDDGTIIAARQSLPQTLTENGHADWSKHLIRDIVPALNAASLSPNYYGFITGGCTPAALFGDTLASIYDQNVQVHLPQQTIATNVESCALNLLLDLFHLDRNVWGHSPTFTTGATASNALGLAMGREWILRCKSEERGTSLRSIAEHGIHEVMESTGVKRIQILSTMPHSSIAKAASILGIGRSNIVSVTKTAISGDFNIGIDLDRLEEEAKKAEVVNILVISAGEVNTGRFATKGLEEMKQMRSICDQHGIWIHVDGAFGLFGRLLTHVDLVEFGEIFRGCQGLELADSITGDGHKLLNVPYDCGFYFCRHRGIADEVFRNGNATYLTSTASNDDMSSPLNIGIENSRRFRALPVYATLQAYGRMGYVDMLKRQIRLARKVVEDMWDSEFYQLLPESSSKTDLLAKTFMVVLFRAKKESLNTDLVRRINATKRMYVSGTTWDGQHAARIAIANWNVKEERDYQIIRNVLRDVAEGR